MVVATMEARQRPGLLVARLQRLELSSTEEFASCRKPNLGEASCTRKLQRLEKLGRLDNVDKERKNAEQMKLMRMLKCSPMTLKSVAYQRLEAAFSMTWM